MKAHTKLLFTALIFVVIIFWITSAEADHDGQVILNESPNLLLKWKLDKSGQLIYFNMTADTTGYVGFGFSSNGGMAGSDMMIAGVYPNGTTYNGDYYGVGNTAPMQDKHADWFVTETRESETQTFISFYRALDTCDTQDYKITDATMRIIWAMGETDKIAYHSSNRGAKSINFFPQTENEFQPEKFKKLDLLVNMTMPSDHTTYWCTIHKAPLFNKKQHIVALDAVLENKPALKHTHHFIVYKCVVPDGYPGSKIDYFEPWLNHTGDYCFKPTNRKFPFLSHCITHQIYGWAKGGVRLVFPPNMGLSLQDSPNEPEYFAIEIHYANPDGISGLQFQTGARLYYTPDLRETEVGLLRIEHDVMPELTVPPNVKDFVVAGHCSGECTEKYFPNDGITIFNNGLHSHFAGRKLKLRHFRGNQELPLVDDEPNFDFNYQQYKMLSRFRKVLKGDQLTVECTYDSTGRDGKAVIGGMSTLEEMCTSFVYYYPKLPFWYCGSKQDTKEHMKLLGISKYERNQTAFRPGGLPVYDILEPKSLAGDYFNSVSYKVNWTKDFVRSFQQEKRYGAQRAICRATEQYSLDQFGADVSYPKNLIEFVAKDQCAVSHSNSVTHGRKIGATICFCIASYIVFVYKCLLKT